MTGEALQPSVGCFRSIEPAKTQKPRDELGRRGRTVKGWPHGRESATHRRADRKPLVSCRVWRAGAQERRIRWGTPHSSLLKVPVWARRREAARAVRRGGYRDKKNLREKTIHCAAVTSLHERDRHVIHLRSPQPLAPVALGPAGSPTLSRTLGLSRAGRTPIAATRPSPPLTPATAPRSSWAAAGSTGPLRGLSGRVRQRPR